MPYTKLQDVWTSINTLYSQSLTSFTTNIRMENAANLTGVNASISDVGDPKTQGIYSLNQFNALNTNLDNSYSIVGNKRYMEDGSMNDDGLNSTFFIVLAGTYQIRSFMSGTTTVYKNGSSAGTIVSARGILTLSSLVIGDRITFNKPCVITHTTGGGIGAQPGIQGAYGGYAGFAFATRVDRYSPRIYIFNLDQNEAAYEVMSTTTSDNNVSNMTSQQDGTINSGDYVIFTPTSSPATNYFILSNKLICVWCGASSQDTKMLFPLSMDYKYGWFSTSGHVFATNNAQVTRLNAGGGYNVLGTATDVGVSTLISSLGTGRNAAFTATSIPTNALGGSYFSGDGCAIYSNGTKSGPGDGTLFTAESQGDGNGGEQTTFTTVKAHARASLTNNGSAWNAFIKAGYSGSTPSQPDYGDVIMRFNSAGTFQEAKSFTGNNTVFPNSSKAYFGNGVGTGTSANAGDFFWCTHDVQGYQDTDVSKRDETNMIMSADVTLPTANQFTIIGIDPYLLGWESAAIACDSYRDGSQFNVWSPAGASFLDEGDVVFKTSVATFDVPFNGEDTYYIQQVGRDYYALQINYQGIITDREQCVF